MDWKEFSTYLRHLPASEKERVKQGFDLAHEFHKDQKRKSGEPYITHPIAIAVRLAYIGADADTIIAALLHDAVEDSGAKLEDFAKRFNGNVSILVDGVTKLSAADVAEKPNLNEKTETLRKIFRLMQQDLRIMVIKLFDRHHNMETIRFLTPEKQKELAQETLDVYVKIADRLSMQDLRYELEAMCLTVLEPELFQSLSQLREQNQVTGFRALTTMREKLQKLFPDLLEKAKIQFELKSWEKLRLQLQAGNAIVTGLSGITMVVVCDDRETCYSMLGAFHGPWRREVMSFQDYINSPQINGYQGLHTTIILEDGTRVRCKIRTREMQEYARKGVTTLCFTPEGRKELESRLPWTTQLPTLAQDTQHKSDDFWQSLQYDILGEAITVHGPDDRAVLVPKDSTALDGAFYLFPDHALKITSMKLDGREAPFHTPLKHAVSLDVIFGEEPTVSREWLSWVRTGLAIARIRQALGERSEEERTETGKEILQHLLSERKRGFLEEFDAEDLEEAAKQLGYHALSDVYTAIADGRLSAFEFYEKIFQKFSMDNKTQPKIAQLLQYSIDMEDTDTMDRVNEVHKKHGGKLKDMHYHRGTASLMGSVSLSVEATSKEIQEVKKGLEVSGAKNIEIITRTKREISLLIAVIVLWAFNPVFAKWLLLEGVQPLSLLTVRFLTFAVFTSVFFLVWKMATKRRFSPIPRLTYLAGLPMLGNASLSFFTYLALTIMPPSVHLTLLRFNTLLLPTIAVTRKSGNVRISLELFSIFLTASCGLLLLFFGISFLPGIALSVLALLSYTFYSIVTERTLQEHKIDIRYPFLLFQMGLLLGLIGLVLLPFQSPNALWNSLTVYTILYVLLCVCIPHTCYSALLKTTRFKHFTDLFLLEVPLAMLLETLVLGTILSPAIYGLVGIILLVLLYLRWNKTTLLIE